MQITELRLYPVKSCRGLSVSEAEIGARGFKGDRRAMIVKEDGVFLTQRTHPKLAQIEPRLEGGLSLTIAGKTHAATLSAERRHVQVWQDVVLARVASAEMNAALSDFLGEKVRLVVMDEGSQRTTPSDFGTPSAVSFADGFPYLITTTASLRALSETVGDPIPMERFRPNIVVETDTPWLEDDWRTLNIGGQEFDLVKPCTRCVITTLDQATGEQVGQSTMKALIETRAQSGPWGHGVVFGMNAIARAPGGSLSVAMSVSAE